MVLNSKYLVLFMLALCLCRSETVTQDGITVTNDREETITSYSEYREVVKDILTLHYGDKQATWSISPYHSQVRIRGNTLEIGRDTVLPKTTFTITATTPTQTATLPFDIEVRGCEYGNFTRVSGDGWFEFFYESKLVSKVFVSDNLLCLPRGLIHFKMIKPWTSNFVFTASDEKDTRFYTANYVGGLLEDDFTNDIDAPIEIIFPRVVSVIRGVEKEFQLVTRGPVTLASISPFVGVSFQTFTFSLSMNEKGVKNYTITVRNKVRSTQLTFFVYCGVCPEETSLITVKKSGNATYMLPSAESPMFYQKSQSFCVPYSSFDLHTMGQGDVILYKDDHIISEYESSEQYSTFKAHFGSLLTNSSQLAYFVGKPDDRWNRLHFDDKAWKRGSEGTWGSFDSAAQAFFRAPFVASNATVTYYLLTLYGEGYAVVFVNGREVSRTSLEDDSSYIPIPSFFVSSGNNVIAVRLVKGKSETIRFALSLETTASPQIPLFEGTASAAQIVEDPKHPPAAAFTEIENEREGWGTQYYPATLTYTFKAAQVVTKITRAVASEGVYSLQIFGVYDEGKKLLGTYSGGAVSALHEGLVFENTQPFSSMQFVFASTQQQQPILVKNIRFYHTRVLACPKKNGHVNMIEGQSFPKSCPLGSTGRKRFVCTRDRAEAKWVEDRSQCFTKNPENGYAFVDWSFTIRGMRESMWEEKSKELTALLVDSTYLRADDVNYLYADFSSDGETTVMTVFSRCDVDKAFGEVILRNFEKLKPRFNELVGKKMGNGFVANIESVVLRRYVNWAVVITVSIVSVIAVALLAVYFATRLKKGGLKVLSKGKDQYLLSEVSA